MRRIFNAIYLMRGLGKQKGAVVVCDVYWLRLGEWNLVRM